MRRARIAPVLAAAAWLACGPVDAPPATTYVTNDCDHSCAAYAQPAPLPAAVCSNHVCASSATIDPTLVISLPGSSLFYPGVTMAVARSALVSPDTPQCHDACVQLPPPAGDQGSFIVSSQLATASGIGVDLGKDLNGNRVAQASLPVHVEYYPLLQGTVPGSATTVYVDAMQAALPLLPQRALVGSPGFFEGPSGTSGYQWHAALAPGLYERDVVPTDDRFPPTIDRVTVSTVGDPVTRVWPIVDDQATPSSRQLTLTWDFASLEGFTAWLRDATTQRRVSARATVDGASAAPLTLNTLLGPLPLVRAGQKVELVVAPPEGAAIPTLVDALPPGDQVGSETLPDLPPVITVSGTVLDPSLAPTPADLVITSVAGGIKIVPVDTQHDAAQPKLSYTTVVRTTADGHYQVDLPPGDYDVLVIPAKADVAGIQSDSLPIAAKSGPPYTAAGLSLDTAPLGLVRGVARLTDGRALSGARVDLLPSASLAPTTDPRAWPRPRSATTAADGSFAIPSDPGLVDVVVHPADGSHLPVASRSAVAIPPGGAVDVTVPVPAPIAIDLVLHDPADNPVAGAVVRAYLPSAGATAPALGPTPVVPIGEWITDATGHLPMFVVPPP